MKDSLEVKAVNPMKWLSKSTLGDFEPDSLNYDATEHQWEKKLKNRISNGSVSPLSVMDRMLKVRNQLRKILPKYQTRLYQKWQLLRMNEILFMMMPKCFTTD